MCFLAIRSCSRRMYTETKAGPGGYKGLPCYRDECICVSRRQDLSRKPQGPREWPRSLRSLYLRSFRLDRRGHTRSGIGYGFAVTRIRWMMVTVKATRLDRVLLCGLKGYFLMSLYHILA